MKNVFIGVVAFAILILCCSYFIPKTNTATYCKQAPCVSEYIRTIEGHKYVVFVATNSGDPAASYHNPSISVTCVHAESCPCKNK